jgi:hypothetical protein
MPSLQERPDQGFVRAGNWWREVKDLQGLQGRDQKRQSYIIKVFYPKKGRSITDRLFLRIFGFIKKYSVSYRHYGNQCLIIGLSKLRLQVSGGEKL